MIYPDFSEAAAYKRKREPQPPFRYNEAVDQAVAVRRRRFAIKPGPASIMAQVSGSGIAAVTETASSAPPR